jgi:hypothetical protein
MAERGQVGDRDVLVECAEGVADRRGVGASGGQRAVSGGELDGEGQRPGVDQRAGDVPDGGGNTNWLAGRIATDLAPPLRIVVM